MSHWTHITSCISVDTCLENKNITVVVEDYLKNAPKITGSEGDVDIFVNRPRGYNTYILADCDNCMYNHTKKPRKEGGFTCEADEGYRCPEGQYQTCVVISIQGDLRDRTRKQTSEEFAVFLLYLAKNYIIRDFSINIEGE